MIKELEGKLTLLNSKQASSASGYRRSNNEDSAFYDFGGIKSPQQLNRSLMTELNDSDGLGLPRNGRNSDHSLNSMCLESTEIDYLRQIVYSYMMGTDPIVSHLIFIFLHFFE